MQWEAPDDNSGGVWNQHEDSGSLIQNGHYYPDGRNSFRQGDGTSWSSHAANNMFNDNSRKFSLNSSKAVKPHDSSGHSHDTMRFSVQNDRIAAKEVGR